MRFDRIWLNARLATLAPAREGLATHEPGAVAATAGRIVFAGSMAELPSGWDAAERACVTPVFAARIADGRSGTPEFRGRSVS